MAKTAAVTSLSLQRRTSIGSSAAQALRRRGEIPGVLYGHGGAAVAISIQARALADLLNTSGQSHIVEATLDGVRDSVLLREVQRDPISHRPIAADFQRISKSDAVFATLSIVCVGTAPGVKDGGVLDVVSHALEVKGPAGSLPDHLSVEVDRLDVGDHILAGDVALPAGFTLVTPRETVVVSIERPRGTEPGTEPAVPTPAAS